MRETREIDPLGIALLPSIDEDEPITPSTVVMEDVFSFLSLRGRKVGGLDLLLLKFIENDSVNKNSTIFALWIR